MQITACKDCQDCKYFEMLDKFYMRCHARDKRYHYGQWVPCDDREEGIFERDINIEETHSKK